VVAPSRREGWASLSRSIKGRESSRKSTRFGLGILLLFTNYWSTPAGDNGEGTTSLHWQFLRYNLLNYLHMGPTALCWAPVHVLIMVWLKYSGLWFHFSHVIKLSFDFSLVRGFNQPHHSWSWGSMNSIAGKFGTAVHLCFLNFWYFFNFLYIFRLFWYADIKNKL
jgi:hypothetical protein